MSVAFRGNSYDVVVIGAGPSGSAAALHLASYGMRVLILDGRKFPRSKACGDAIHPAGVQLLNEMGMRETVSRFKTVFGFRIHNDSHSRTSLFRDVDTDTNTMGSSIVAPRKILDSLLVQEATARGAFFWNPCLATNVEFTDGRVSGVRLRAGGSDFLVKTRHVIAAEGASSRLASRFGSFRSDQWLQGIGYRAYFHTRGTSDKLELVLPLLSPNNGRVLSGCGWIFPVSEELSNAGIAFYPVRQQDLKENARRVFDHFMAGVRSRTSGRLSEFAAPKGGVLRTGLHPGSCVHKGIMFVGDAACIDSPFTSGGITAALGSGKYAAETIIQISEGASEQLAYQAYIATLRKQYGDSFATTKEALPKYGFIWHLVGDTLHDHNEVFRALRQSIVSSTSTSRLKPDMLTDDHLTPFLADVQSTIDHILKSEFAPLPRVTDLLLDPLGMAMRSGLLFFISQQNRETLARLAAAVEISHLAFVFHQAVMNRQESTFAKSPTTYSNTFSILVGDYLSALSFSVFGEENALRDATNAVLCASEMFIKAEVHENKEANSEQLLKLAMGSDVPFYDLACTVAFKSTSFSSGSRAIIRLFAKNLCAAVSLINKVRSNAARRPQRLNQAGTREGLGSITHEAEEVFVHLTFFLECLESQYLELPNWSLKAGIRHLLDRVEEAVKDSTGGAGQLP